MDHQAPQDQDLAHPQVAACPRSTSLTQLVSVSNTMALDPELLPASQNTPLLASLMMVALVKDHAALPTSSSPSISKDLDGEDFKVMIN